jgi:hypothetical protein
MKLSYLAPALLLAFGVNTPAAADCAWDWLCNGEGACKHMPICDSVDEIPPARPDSQPPAMPPLSMRPHRIAGAGIGASNTLTCEHIMRKGKTGRWYWHEACYCSDPSKAKDPSSPFSNIVRCDGK